MSEKEKNTDEDFSIEGTVKFRKKINWEKFSLYFLLVANLAKGYVYPAQKEDIDISQLSAVVTQQGKDITALQTNDKLQDGNIISIFGQINALNYQKVVGDHK